VTALVAIGAALLLVAIGTVEAFESARQLSKITRFDRLQPAGAGLSALGLVASAAVYVGLGWWIRADRTALRLGAIVGLAAGLVGGSIRAWLIAGVVRDAVSRYVAAAEWFVLAVLVVFVAVSVVVSGIGGAALAFLGARISRASRSRPRP
jgi:hypothetical protein